MATTAPLFPSWLPRATADHANHTTVQLRSPPPSTPPTFISSLLPFLSLFISLRLRLLSLQSPGALSEHYSAQHVFD